MARQRAFRKAGAALASCDLRRARIESLDARMVLSASSFVSAALVGPTFFVDAPVASASMLPPNMTRAGFAHEPMMLRDGMAAEHHFETQSIASNWIESRPGFATISTSARGDNFNFGPVSSSGFATSSIQLGATNGKVGYDVFGGSGIGGSSLWIVDRGNQGGFVELRPSRYDSFNVVVVPLQWVSFDRVAPKFFGERPLDLNSGRDELVSKYQPPSTPAYISSSTIGMIKDVGANLDGGPVTIGHPGPGQIAAAGPADGGARSLLGITPAVTSQTTAVPSLISRANESVIATSLQFTSPALSATTDGGLVDISSSLSPGKSVFSKGLTSRDAISKSPAESQDLEQFWGDLGEELESLDPIELALDGEHAKTDDAESESADDLAVFVDQAVAIHGGEGGMVELSAQQSPANLLPQGTSSSRAIAGSAQPGKSRSVEIEMDTAVAMFQAFELETSPTTRQAAEAKSETPEADSAEASAEQPLAQPVDQASLSPLSVLVAVATTAVGTRERKSEQQKLALASAARR